MAALKKLVEEKMVSQVKATFKLLKKADGPAKKKASTKKKATGEKVS